MDIIVSHNSAFMFWRRFIGNKEDLPRSRRTCAMEKMPKLTPEIRDELHRWGVVTPDSPVLHVLCADAQVRHAVNSVRFHVFSGVVPLGALLRISEHVLVTSPEFTFAGLAQGRTVQRLSMVASELCGTYALISCADGTRIQERVPLTDVDAMFRCLTAVSGESGYEKAKRALTVAFEGAASPMEAKLALLLSLPLRLGGLGFPRPVLNAEVALSDVARRVYPHGVCRCDLYWPSARVDVEYDGLEYHGGWNGRTKDVARAAALRAQGIETIALTYPQMVDEGAFAIVVRDLAHRLGHRMRTGGPQSASARSVLRAELGLQDMRRLSA